MQTEIAAYLAHGKAQGLAERSLDSYCKRLSAMASYLRRNGRKEVRDVQDEDLDDYLLDLADRGIRRSTRHGIASTVRGFFTWLAESGKVLSNPARDMPLPDDRDAELLPPPLEEREVAELLDGLPRRNAIALRNRLHLELLYSCGLRIAESVALDVGDLNLAARTVHVRKGKGGKERLLPMPGGVHGALRDYLALRRSLLRGPDHCALLLGRHGKRLNPATFRDWLRKLNEKRGEARRIHPHLLRHSIAVHLLRGGADIRHVQAFLGHSCLDTTKTYLRLVPGRLKEEYEKAMPEIVA